MFLLVSLILFKLFFQEVKCIQEWNDNVDFIIVGAGTTGSALASRLSEDEQHRVLLLEAGGEPQVHNDVPYFAPGPFGGNLDWNYMTEPQKHSNLALIDKRAVYSRGKGLGGSTLINALLYNRGDPKDFDNWKKLGNEGWGYEDILPIFKRIEDYGGFLNQENERYRGTGGPMSVSRAPFQSNLTQMFIDAGRELGYPEVDYNGKSQRGFSHLQFILRNGSRCSTYKAYLKDARSRSNLRILTHAHVYKIEINDNNRATGVIFKHDEKLWIARSKKEIIISAGAVDSPKLLLLSGIGPRATLEKYQIPVVSNLPGVGQNLEDHVIVINTIVTLNGEIGFRFSRDVNAENFELYETKGQGPLTVPVRCLGIAFVDSEYSNASSDWPDLELLFYQTTLLLNLAEDYKVSNAQPKGKSIFSVAVLLLRPKSVGSISIRSSNPDDPPVIDPNYLSKDDDVKRLVSGIKIFQKLIQTKAFQQYGAVWDNNSPTKGCEQYQFKSDEYFECFLRHYTTSISHPSCTCRMGNDEGAVVDSKLKVHGIQNLRVVDLSVTPKIISGHPMAAAIMIGEKAADFIKEEWKKRVSDEL